MAKAQKTTTITIRAKPVSQERLTWIQTHSAVLKDLSYSSIIEYLIYEHVQIQELSNANLPPFKPAEK